MAAPVFSIRTRDPGSYARTGTLHLAHGEVRTPAFVPLATKAVVKTLEVREAADLGFDMVLGNTFHLFLSPGHELIEKLGGLHRFQRWDRPIITDSGGFQVFSMGHGTVADEIKGRAAQFVGERAGAILSIEEEGVRFRSYLDGSEQFMGPETSMAVQAALRSDIALVFDECTPFHADRDYTARSTERTHRWLDRCLAWHAEHGPEGQVLYGIVQGGTEEDLRRASAQEVAARPVAGIAIGGSLGEDKAQMFEVVEWTVEELPEERPRHLLGHRRGRRSGARRRTRDRHLRLRDADPDRPPRHGDRARPGAPLARRSGQGPLEGGRRADPRGLSLPGLRRGLLARLHPLPAAREGADRHAPADDPQPRLPPAADGRVARRDRHAPPPRGRRRGPRRRRALGTHAQPRMSGEAFKAFEADGWSARAATYDALMARATALAIEPLLDAASVGPGVRVLEVGCGLGALAAAAAARGAQVTGIDLAEGMLAEARRRHPGIEFVRADAERLPFGDGAFDVALGAFVVNHLPDPEAAAAELRRVASRVALAMWGPADEVAILGLPGASRAGPDRRRATGPGRRALRRPQRARRAARRRRDGPRIRTTLPVDSLDALWDGIRGGTVRTAARLAAATPAQREHARTELARLAEPHRTPAGYALPITIYVATR